MTTDERIESGALPRSLEGEDWRLYDSGRLVTRWPCFCAMWQKIAWVRYQAFERDADNEAAAEDDQ